MLDPCVPAYAPQRSCRHYSSQHYFSHTFPQPRLPSCKHRRKDSAPSFHKSDTAITTRAVPTYLNLFSAQLAQADSHARAQTERLILNPSVACILAMRDIDQWLAQRGLATCHTRTRSATCCGPPSSLASFLSVPQRPLTTLPRCASRSLCCYPKCIPRFSIG